LPVSLPVPPPPERFTLSLLDALPISRSGASAAALWATLRALPLTRDGLGRHVAATRAAAGIFAGGLGAHDSVALVVEPELDIVRSGEHTSELQSRGHLVSRLLLEKKK